MPGAGLFGTSGVESGKAAPLVGGPPGVELHTTFDGLPNGDVGDTVPVVLPAKNVGIVPNAAPGIIAAVRPVRDVEAAPGTVDGVSPDVAPTTRAVDVNGAATVEPDSGDDASGTVEPGKSVINDEAGVADSKIGAVELAAVDVAEIGGIVGIAGAAEVADVKGLVTAPPPVANTEMTGTAAVPGAICPVGVAQVTTVPGVVGSEAIGTGASVVPGEFGWVVAENGLGPLSGDVTIVAGIVGSPIAVVPMVETCAVAALQPANKTAVVNSKRRIVISLSIPI